MEETGITPESTSNMKEAYVFLRRDGVRFGGVGSGAEDAEGLGRDILVNGLLPFQMLQGSLLEVKWIGLKKPIIGNR